MFGDILLKRDVDGIKDQGVRDNNVIEEEGVWE